MDIAISYEELVVYEIKKSTQPCVNVKTFTPLHLNTQGFFWGGGYLHSSKFIKLHSVEYTIKIRFILHSQGKQNGRVHSS